MFKKWNGLKSDTKSGTINNRSVLFPFEQANRNHVNGTIAFPSEHKTNLVCNRSVSMWTAYLSVPEIGTKMERNDCTSMWNRLKRLIINSSRGEDIRHLGEGTQLLPPQRDGWWKLKSTLRKGYGVFALYWGDQHSYINLKGGRAFLLVSLQPSSRNMINENLCVLLGVGRCYGRCGGVAPPRTDNNEFTRQIWDFQQSIRQKSIEGEDHIGRKCKALHQGHSC